MSDKTTPHAPPTLFLRLFLSHLLLLAFVALATAGVFEYLFEPGIKYFLLHKPLIVFPVVLALIGIAGMLAAWTAGAVAQPLEDVIESLESDDPARGVQMYRGPYKTEETADLIRALRLYQRRLFSSEQRTRIQTSRMRATKTIVVTVSNAGIMLSANLAAEIFTGKSRQQLLYGRFVEYFTVHEKDGSAVSLRIAALDPFRGMMIAANDMSGKQRMLVWASMPVYDTTGKQTGTLLFGTDA